MENEVKMVETVPQAVSGWRKFLKVFSIIIFVFSLFPGIPIFGVLFLFGVSGSYPTPFYIMGLGYLIFIISSFISIFKPKAYFAIGLAIVLLITGEIMDNNFWTSQNNDLCLELRANPTCIEDENGFQCSNFDGVGFTTSSSICKNKISAEVLEKKRLEKRNAFKEANPNASVLDYANFNNVIKADKAYSLIVDQIISLYPKVDQDHSIFNQLIAINNCLTFELGTQIQAEQRETQELAYKKLSEEQLKKYYAYFASYGINVNPKIVVAALPLGNDKLSCKDIK